MIKLHQAFYGRDPSRGYRLLASSNETFNRTAADLCAAVGTPDGISAIEPFYLNFIAGQYRYMIAGRSGKPDEGGRKTLFFHVYIGDHQELRAANFGIGSLIHANAFRSEYEPGPVLETTFEEGSFSLPWGNTPIVLERDEKLAIRSSKPELSLISGILKKSLDETSWASFSYRPLDDFRLYVISEYVALPGDRKCVSTAGTAVGGAQRPPQNGTPERQLPPAPECKRSCSGRIWLVLFFLSLAANILLVVALLSSGGKPVTPPPRREEKTVFEPSRTPAVTREAVIKELRGKFDPRDKLNVPWNKAISGTLVEGCYARPKSKDLLVKAEKYIQFVHKYIFEEKETSK